MKTTITSLCLVLSLGLGFSQPALADRGGYEGGGYRGGYYAPAAQQRHHNHGGYYGGGSYRGYGWVGPAAALALTGIAVGVAASNYYAPPPVYVAQPQVVYEPPPRTVYVVPSRPAYVVTPQPVYAPAPGGYWGY